MEQSTVVNIGVLVFPGCLRSSAVTPLDVFQIANTVASYRPAAGGVEFRGQWVSARGEASATVGGLTFALQPLAGAALDALMVPGVAHRTTDDLAQSLAVLGPEQEALRAFAASGRPLASSCSGTCLLARTGLLDGRRATTSWWLGPYFRQQFPRVILDAEELLMLDGSIISSGGVTSCLDLALWLVGHFGGEELRQLTAKILIIDSNRSSQAPYVAAAMMEAEGHAVIERARRWLNGRLDRPWTMAELAEHCHTTQRTLLRRFQDAMSLSPVQYAQQLRVERAKVLLESTRLSLDAITQRCGYEDVSTFSKVFKRWVQLTPREYRVRFGLRQ